MRTATITFHWVANYGAVLQAWALQRCLQKLGHETEIIDYRPRAVLLKQRFRALIKRNRTYFMREKSLQAFRREHLRLTEKHYPSFASLKKAPAWDAVIAGSDQVWNESFTLRGEGKKTLSYFLAFAPEETRRIGYAVSFGFREAAPAYASAVKPEIRRFSAIGVREADGLDILKSLGCEGELVCDPTALLERVDYDALLPPARGTRSGVFPFVLRGSADTLKAAECAGRLLGGKPGSARFAGSMGEWLSGIRDAELVVTNSFHCMMLSVILGTPFIALTAGANRSGMNSRLTTLAGRLGLSSRVLDGFSEERVKALAEEKIDWESVWERLAEMRGEGLDFLNRALG